MRQHVSSGNIGWVIALLVLVIAVILWIVGGYDREALLGLIAALALARLL